ncbi:MAG: prolipoprotein diacylglyceryl transferase [Syntrophomonadaceae bacterium]|nr:prolipoprotein diacylglyceryl transferase [Syntrophomonadaceae bacterium]MDD3889428.1 prolipoprotein diacylglyceryl transferase [Syntrophomonadaceae bacterium]MDD4548392.1 prolipoprotein diacylglyceryl transferase [Syntrophomonadaceae bacterium]
MHPVLFRIGTINIYSWGFMLAIAVVIAILGISRLFDREGYDKEMVLDLVILAVVCGVLGGRISYIIVYEWDAFMANPLSFLSLSQGGLAGMIWYGGFIGGLIPFIIYLWRKGLSFWKVADMFAPYLALGYALVRIGCFLNGCCYGKVTDSFMGVVFPFVDNLHRYPTQLYSSVLNFILFIFLLWFFPRRRFSGQVVLLYLMGYSVYRFIIEFFRFSLIMYGPISLGQVYTSILFIIALVIYYWLHSRNKKRWW